MNDGNGRSARLEKLSDHGMMIANPATAAREPSLSDTVNDLIGLASSALEKGMRIQDRLFGYEEGRNVPDISQSSPIENRLNYLKAVLDATCETLSIIDHRLGE